MKKLVYISHPSGGREDNKINIENIMRALYSDEEISNKYCFVSAVHNYGFRYFEVDYDTSISYCTDLQKHCDEIWVFGDWKSSRGCNIEVNLAREIDMKTRFFDNNYNTIIEQVKKSLSLEQ